MKPKFVLLALVVSMSFLSTPFAQQNNEGAVGSELLVAETILSVDFGPLAEENVWERISIPLIPETFGVNESDFDEAMKSIRFIRIRTELNAGSDIGSIDSVILGDAFASTFDKNAEGWSAMGDGSMYWEAQGGKNGGFISVADESNGEWHWAVAPTSWSGDISDQVGKNFSFYIKTNSSGYNGVIELHTVEIRRIVLSVENNEIKKGETASLQLNITPAPLVETKIKIAATNAMYFDFDTLVTVAAGVSETSFDVVALETIPQKIKGNFTASASGYNASSVTLHVAVSSGVESPDASTLQVYPNPAVKHLIIEQDQSNPMTIEIFNALGQRVYSGQGSGERTQIEVGAFAKGRYTVKMNTGGVVVTKSVIIQ